MVSPAAQSAVDTVRDRLSTSWRDWSVTPGDLQDIARTIDRLSPAERAEVIDTLSDADLTRLAGELMQDRPFIGGLSKDERAELFGDIAAGLNGQQLARVSDAFAASGNRVDNGFDVVTEFGDAVATRAGTQAKLDFVREQTRVANGDSAIADDSGAYVHGENRWTDPDAVAVATVLGSLRGQAAAEGFAMLSDDQLATVVEAATAMHTRTSSMMGATATTARFESDGLTGLVDAAVSMRSTSAGSARIDAADQQARLFDAIGTRMQDIRDINGLLYSAMPDRSGTVDAMAGEMTRILERDTTGVMRALAYDPGSDDGRALASWMDVNIRGGTTDMFGTVMTRLQTGNAGNQDPFHYLSAGDRQVDSRGNVSEIFMNAGTLGYFVGAAEQATRNIAASDADRASVESALIGSVLTAIDKFGVGGRAVGTGAAILKEWKAQIADGLQPSRTDFGSALRDAAMLYDPVTQTRVIDSARIGEYNRGYLAAAEEGR